MNTTQFKKKKKTKNPNKNTTNENGINGFWTNAPLSSGSSCLVYTSQCLVNKCWPNRDNARRKTVTSDDAIQVVLHESPLFVIVMLHDDVMTWKRYLNIWPFERGIHRSPVDSTRKGPDMRSCDVIFNMLAWTNGRIVDDLRSKVVHVTSLYRYIEKREL